MSSSLHRELGVPESIKVEHNLFNKLIEKQVREQSDLDFKSDAYDSRDDQKKFELAKDVCAMANSGGGWIICGIAEKNESASGFSGLTLTSTTETSIHQLVESQIDPPLLVETRVYHDGEGHDTVLAIRVYDSGDKPHLLHARRTRDNTRAFVVPVRRGARTSWLTERELRGMYRDSQRRSIDRKIEQNEYLAEAIGMSRAFTGTSLIVVAAPTRSYSGDSWTEEEIRSIFTHDNLRRHINERVVISFLSGDGMERKRGYKREIVKSEAHKGRGRVELLDDGAVEIIVELGGIAGDNQRAAPSYPVGRPSHIRTIDLEYALAESISVVDKATGRDNMNDVDIYARLVYQGPEPIVIRRMDTVIGMIRDESEETPVRAVHTVTAQLSAQRDEHDIQEALYLLASDILNQGEIRYTQYIHDPGLV